MGSSSVASSGALSSSADAERLGRFSATKPGSRESPAESAAAPRLRPTPVPSSDEQQQQRDIGQLIHTQNSFVPVTYDEQYEERVPLRMCKVLTIASSLREKRLSAQR
uniref:Uncharacterized protein n=1 Tax=Sphaerodactylus townsendi TaxID=933632 RepID=A0ACB8F4H2_9SAUR